MVERVRRFLGREITMPRWAVVIDFAYRLFLIAGACVVIVLWYQAATRDEEADRNARIQACSARYAAVSAAWDARALKLDQQAEEFDRQGEVIYADLVNRAANEQPLGDLPVRYREAQNQARERTRDAEMAAERVEEMTRRRIGLAVYSAASVLKGNDFVCPPLTPDLDVSPIYPDGFDP